MAYIAPNSTIQLFKNLPLNPDYENTYYFHKREDDYQETGQNTFFGERAVATFTENSYLRKEKGVIKLQAPYASVYDCCYMRYRNTNFEYKWFYAFILKVEYINNETVEITFQIDVMQTWLPYVDYDFEECFIEREHTADDTHFHNLVAENLEYGDTYVLNNTTREYNFYTDQQGNYAPLNVCMIAGKDSLGHTPDSTEGDRLLNGVYVPVYIYALRADDMTIKLMRYAGTSAPLYDDIIALYMYPAKFGTFDPDIAQSTSGFPPVFDGGWNVDANMTTIDGYRPYNNKLFNYPYTFLSVSNNNGKSAEFKWEGWAVGETWTDLATLIAKLGRFDIKGTIMPPVTAMLYPSFYNKVSELKTNSQIITDHTNYDEGLIIDNFPQCPWVSDTYKAWLAQNKASLVTGLVASTLTGILGTAMAVSMPWMTPTLASLSAASGAVGIGANVMGLAAKVTDAQAMPSQAKGQIMSEYLTAGIERYKYTAKQLSIRADFAKKIDQYFQMYGYASHEIKKPYMHHRQKWWYTKTVGCDITGSLPADDIKEICKIFDKGIRFWWDKGRIGTFDTANITRTPDFPV